MSLTREQVRAWFEEEGITVSEWARQHGFGRAEVYALLLGRTRGRRGKSHQVALALGLKRKSQQRPDNDGVGLAEPAGVEITNSASETEPANNEGGKS